VANKAKLVSGLCRRQNDPAGRPAGYSKRAGSTVVDVKGSHAVYVSQPQAVALLIEKAAMAALVTAK
jgi:hypothetical protein